MPPLDPTRFEDLNELEDDVLAEIVREAEERLKAQLQIATANHQGTLSIAAVQVGSGTAILAAGVSMARGSNPDWWLAGLAIAFATGMAVVAHRAMSSMAPEEFNIPGHRPLHWREEGPVRTEPQKRTIKETRILQAANLEDEIGANKLRLDLASRKVRQSLNWWIGMTFVAIFVLVITLLIRNLPGGKI